MSPSSGKLIDKHKQIQAEKISYNHTKMRMCKSKRCNRLRSIAQFDGDSDVCKICVKRGL